MGEPDGSPGHTDPEPSEGGRLEAARLPKGWTGPVRTSGHPGARKGPRVLFARPLPEWRLAAGTPAFPRPCRRTGAGGAGGTFSGTVQLERTIGPVRTS